jgi:hypothetical protein
VNDVERPRLTLVQVSSWAGSIWRMFCVKPAQLWNSK